MALELVISIRYNDGMDTASLVRITPAEVFGAFIATRRMPDGNYGFSRDCVKCTWREAMFMVKHPEHLKSLRGFFRLEYGGNIPVLATTWLNTIYGESYLIGFDEGWSNPDDPRADLKIPGRYCHGHIEGFADGAAAAKLCGRKFETKWWGEYERMALEEWVDDGR
jgi:hypothetical protein